jgi:glycosyltransferase involved in cell wall biosynthesis
MSSNPEAVRPVLHLPVSVGAGGAEQVVSELIRRAKARGERHRLVALRGTPAARALVLSSGEEVVGPVAKSADRLSRWDGARLAAHAARSLSPGEVVHAHLPWPDGLGTALLARGRAPLLVTFHLLPAHPILGLGDVVLAPLLDLKRAARLASKLAPVVFTAVSDGDAARLRETFPGIRVERVYNSPTSPRGDVPPPLPFGDGARLFAVGSLTERKGFDRLLRACASEPMRSLAFSLCIAGEGEARSALVELAAGLGLAQKVRFVGHVNAPYLYPQADLFVTASRAEGLPLVLLEAMASGIAVAASDIAPHREVLAGLPEALLDADESRWPAQLAAFVESAASRANVAAAAKRRADAHFSAQAQDAAFASLYRELAESSRR